MEEINLKELFDYIKERILVIIIIILAVLVAGCIYSIFLKKPMYQSETTVVLVSDDGTSGGGTTTQSDVNLNQSLVSTYSEIVKSRRIADKVIKDLSLDYTIDELLNNITVSNTSDTEIIKIVVKDQDKALAADIANEIVKVFGEEIKDIYRLQNVSVIDVAEEAEEPYNINMVKDLVIYLLVGIVLSCGAVFVVYYFDTTIKSAEEVEKKLGLPVFGIVPRVKYKEKK